MKSYQEIQDDYIQIYNAVSVDALQKFIKSARLVDAEEVQVLISVAEAAIHAWSGRADEALKLYQEAERYYTAASDQFGMMVSIGGMGEVYWRKSEYRLAIEHLDRAIEIGTEENRPLYLALLHVTMGNVYSDIADFSRSLQFYQKSLVIYERLDAPSATAGSTTNIGLVYAAIGDNETCLEYLMRALEIFQETGYEEGMANVMGNIGCLYIEMNDFDQAEEWLTKSMSLARQHEMSREIGYYTIALSDVLRRRELFQDALDLLDANQAAINENPVPVSGAILVRGLVARDTADYVKAKECFLKAYQQHIDRNARGDAAPVLKALRDLAKQTGEFEDYIKYNEMFQEIEASIRGAATARKLGIEETEHKLAEERRQRAEEKLKHKIERDRELAVLHSTLPKHIADRVVRGEAVNDHIDDASVMFIDIVGFTEISSRIPAGHVVHLLDSIFAECDKVCNEHAVTKIKTIGDSYMAVAGLQESDESHARNAALCALEILKSLDELEITMPPELGDTSWTKNLGDIQVRIGLHSGPVVAGVLGKERMQYDVWGDTVNVASRMESTGEPGRIHVSEAFAKALRSSDTSSDPLGDTTSDTIADSITIETRGTTEVKGKGKMQTFWLSSELSIKK